MEYEKLTEKIIGLVIEVHRNLGPGLLENVYKKCLIRDFPDETLKSSLLSDIIIDQRMNKSQF
jgi:GxxExxY protein